MVNKYDYGYVIHPGTTTEWAYNAVKENSVVLELGCSNGNLTMHLQKKNCIVDIIEINEDAGTQAAQYARRSLLGESEGNVEEDIWFKKLKDQQYDYIIILDVLEHLRSPESVLKKVRQLLKPMGSLILSVPNMAHNSVLIDMLRNKLKYNQLGILDNTHLRFVTKENLERMIRECGFCAVKKHAIQIPVGSNEIKNNYEDLAPQWEVLLKDRPFAEVFQFIYELKINGQEASLNVEPLDTTKWLVKVYYKENDESNFDEEHARFQYIDHKSGKASIPFCGENPGVLRIIPLYRSCVLDNLRISVKSDAQDIEILDYKTNGFKIKNGCYSFTGEYPEIIVHLPEKFEISELNIYFHDIMLNNPELGIIQNYLQEREGYIQFLEREINENLSKEKEALRAERDGLYREKESLCIEYNQACSEKGNLQIECDSLRSEKEEVQAERDDLRSEKEELQAECNGLRSEKEELQAECNSLQNEKENLQMEYSELENEKNSLETECDCMIAEKTILEKNNEELHNQLNVIQNSRTWRVCSFFVKLLKLDD